MNIDYKPIELIFFFHENRDRYNTIVEEYIRFCQTIIDKTERYVSDYLGDIVHLSISDEGIVKDKKYNLKDIFSEQGYFNWLIQKLTEKEYIRFNRIANEYYWEKDGGLLIALSRQLYNKNRLNKKILPNRYRTVLGKYFGPFFNISLSERYWREPSLDIYCSEFSFITDFN